MGPSKHWINPVVGCFKVNWDVGMDWSMDRFGLGMVVRDSNGHCVVARTVPQHGRVDPTTGEALASFHAVDFCKELGLSCIILKGDA